MMEYGGGSADGVPSGTDGPADAQERLTRFVRILIEWETAGSAAAEGERGRHDDDEEDGGTRA